MTEKCEMHYDSKSAQACFSISQTLNALLSLCLSLSLSLSLSLTCAHTHTHTHTTQSYQT